MAQTPWVGPAASCRRGEVASRAKECIRELDSLILSGELRLKQNFNDATFNFPGVGGNPGLVFNDGEERIMTIAGVIGSNTGITSSINPGGQNVTDISAARGFIFTATMMGDGTFSLDYGHDTSMAGREFRKRASPRLATGGSGGSRWVEITKYKHPDPSVLKMGPIGLQIHSSRRKHPTSKERNRALCGYRGGLEHAQVAALSLTTSAKTCASRRVMSAWRRIRNGLRS